MTVALVYLTIVAVLVACGALWVALDLRLQVKRLQVRTTIVEERMDVPNGRNSANW